MKIFVTGATGFVGAAVTSELIAAGHSVLGLTRSDRGAEALRAMGAEAHHGDLDDLASLKRGAEGVDGVIHTAFNHDFSRYAQSCEADRHVIAALGSVLAGSARPLVVTSGTGILPGGHLVTEETRPATGPGAPPRAASEEAAAALAEQGVNVSIVRLPPSTHGVDDHGGFVPLLIKLAREKGVAAYVGEGSNRWPSVARLDAARLYRRAVEIAAADARYHAVAEEGIAFRDIAGVIARRLDVPLVSIAREDAAGHFGWFAHFAQIDVPADSAWTRQALDWQPTGPGLLEDLDGPAYFAGQA